MHIPVLLEESIKGLELKRGDVFLDCTLGLGGHSFYVCRVFGKDVRIVGIDLDEEAIRQAEEKIKEAGCQVQTFKSNFNDLDQVLDQAGVDSINGALFDLGINSFQLEASGRGFSFQKDEPLLMTMSKVASEGELTAYEIVNSWPEEKLADVIWKYGEEPRSRKIAKAIVEARRKNKIMTSLELALIIKKAIMGRSKINPATKTFQALRIAVNGELVNLEEALPKVFRRMAEDGRIAVISFHSLEDRIVKNFFKKLAQEDAGKILTKRPIYPSKLETAKNPRARSAKLRIFQKLK